MVGRRVAGADVDVSCKRAREKVKTTLLLKELLNVSDKARTTSQLLNRLQKLVRHWERTYIRSIP